MSLLSFLRLRRSRPTLQALSLTAAFFAAVGSSPAQVPAVPAVPAAPVAAVPAVAAAPAAPAAPSNLWSFLCPTEDQKAACKAKLCKLPVTQLFNNMLKPVSLLSGGLVTSCCPTGPSAQDLAAPPDSAEGAAARIQQSEAEAKKRRATIRYLGTVDCRYWPEAEAALITALRTDPNECVRFEAALALTNGCCCTKPIIDTLVITVSGANPDKHPAEMSPRVREQARMALDKCLCRFTQVVAAPEPNQRPEKPEAPRPAAPDASAQLIPVAALPASPTPPVGQRSLLEVALHSTATTAEPPLAAAAPAPLTPVAAPTAARTPSVTGQRSLIDIFSKSLSAGQ